MKLRKRKATEDVSDYLTACEVDLNRALAERILPEHLAEAVAQLESPRVLDIGCGIGQSLILLAATNATQL